MANRQAPKTAGKKPRKGAQKPHPLALGLSALTLLLVLGFFVQSGLSLAQEDVLTRLVQLISQPGR